MRECMEADKRVQVLMSTYNGKRFLKEQLDSILNQDFQGSIKVLIRDDGSTDGTTDLLCSYADDDRIKVILGNNVGINASIMELLKGCDKGCDYFAFSDQDDVWLKNKISHSVRILMEEEQKHPDQPLLFASSSCITDERLRPRGASVLPKYGVSFYNSMVQNIMPGHTQMINYPLINILLKTDSSDIQIVDWWVNLVASSLGKVHYDINYTVLHRQHRNNAIGYENNQFRLFLHRLNRMLGKKRNEGTYQLQKLYTNYCESMPEQFAKELYLYLNSQNNILTRFFYLSKAKIYRQSAVETGLLYFLYLFGKYKI